MGPLRDVMEYFNPYVFLMIVGYLIRNNNGIFMVITIFLVIGSESQCVTKFKGRP